MKDPPRPVSSKELAAIVKQLRVEEDKVMEAKGADYTRGSPDRLANFHQAGRATGLSPRQVWGVYFMKQVEAVMAWVRTGKLESESLLSRFVDIRNYCALGCALAHVTTEDLSGYAPKSWEVLSEPPRLDLAALRELGAEALARCSGTGQLVKELTDGAVHQKTTAESPPLIEDEHSVRADYGSP